ncbi:MAG: sigma-54-dependent Fis family transcriptional regulator [Ignavibacteriales bacterium]|nr:sigma-54-dependent Fis family transcriptional regulator [Ignavibacteriales bacterium]
MSKTETLDPVTILIGNSRVIKNIQKLILKLAGMQKDVIITGEPGVGKTTVAQAIHFCTNPKGSLKILSHTITNGNEIKDLIEKDLQNTDTIVIKEIEEFSFLQQSLICQLINDRSDKRFTRIIVTTKKDITALKSQGKLFNELADVLSKFETIMLPPLDERQEDIPLLVQHFVSSACRAIGKEVKTLDINVIDVLSKRNWQENIRELKSVVEQAVLISNKEMIELPAYIFDEHTQLDGILRKIKEQKKFAFDGAFANLERTLIQRTLEAAAYNQTKSAEILGISGANFRYRIRKYKIRRKPW